jgi:hypothetical protein
MSSGHECVVGAFQRQADYSSEDLCRLDWIGDTPASQVDPQTCVLDCIPKKTTTELEDRP